MLEVPRVPLSQASLSLEELVIRLKFEKNMRKLFKY